jgi:predicted permease
MQVAAPANYLDWREQVAAFDDVAGYGSGLQSRTLTGRGEPQVVSDASVTGNFFEMLGVRAAVGRVFRDEETWSDLPPTVILSDGFWERRFGRDPSVVGSSITLDGVSHEVIGVMPASFAFPFDSQDIWITERWNRDFRGQTFFRRAHWLNVIARLAPGATIEEANSQLQLVVERLKVDYPETNRVMGAGITPLHAFLVRDRRTPLLVLLGAVGLLLLLACANVGNLLLVRAVGRRREMGLRTALGAERRRLLRQMLTESLLLSAAGGVGGVLLGLVGVRALSAIQPADLPRAASIVPDHRVLAYVLAITVASGVLFGILPAWKSARTSLSDVLRDDSRTGTAGRGSLRF